MSYPKYFCKVLEKNMIRNIEINRDMTAEEKLTFHPKIIFTCKLQKGRSYKMLWFLHSN